MNAMRHSIARCSRIADCLLVKETAYRHSPAEFQTRCASGTTLLNNIVDLKLDLPVYGRWWRSLISLVPSLSDVQLLAAPKKKVGACFSATSRFAYTCCFNKKSIPLMCRCRHIEKGTEVPVSIYDSYQLCLSAVNVNGYFHHTLCHQNAKMMTVQLSISEKGREYEGKKLQTTS